MPDWPHSPIHRLVGNGAYFLTGATYKKDPIFRGRDALEYLCSTLLGLAEQYEWELQAWAVFPNHYHFVAFSPTQPGSLHRFVRHFHSVTAIEANRRSRTPGRKVWFQYWETKLTYARSFFARLSYVHRNAVRHNVVREPSLYPWCSAGWFERRAGAAFCKRILQMKVDRISVVDDFEVEPGDI